ncbi:MAG TPA: choice-of-anchor Q domain-containing protein [Actinomycetota bacterium]|nr:choice-of-anchor Q domain-containing protein [Actinomycetota bacterium]
MQRHLQQCIDGVAASGNIIELDSNDDLGTATVDKSLTLKASDGFHPSLDFLEVDDESQAQPTRITVRDLTVKTRVEVLPTIEGDEFTIEHLTVRQQTDEGDPAIEVRILAPSTVDLVGNTAGSMSHQMDAILVDNMSPDGPSHVRVLGNQVSDHGASDAYGGIQVVNHDAGKLVAEVDGNSVWDVGQCGCGAASGILVWAPGGPVTADVVGNSIDRSAGSGLAVDGSLGHRVTAEAFDNVISHTVYPVYVSDGSPSRVTLHAGTNDFFANTSPPPLAGHSLGTGNLHVNPKYKDAPFGDLRLLAGSPLVDSGLVCSPGGVENLDAAGHGRLHGAGVDIGAFELGAGAPTGNAYVGGGGADVFTGTPGADILCGMGGADALNGAGGADWIDGGDGPDRLTGGAGADVLLGGAGNDPCLDAQDGHPNDSVDGGPGTDHYRSDAGDHVVRAEVRSSCST